MSTQQNDIYNETKREHEAERLAEIEGYEKQIEILELKEIEILKNGVIGLRKALEKIKEILGVNI